MTDYYGEQHQSIMPCQLHILVDSTEATTIPAAHTGNVSPESVPKPGHQGYLDRTGTTDHPRIKFPHIVI